MVRIKGSVDLKKRKTRNDKGKFRKSYDGKPVKYHSDYLKYFRENYGKNKEFTEEHKLKSRISQRKYYNKNKKEIQKSRRQIIKSDPNKKIRERLRLRIRLALKSYTKTGKSMSSGKYGIDYNSIIKQLKPFPNDLSKYHIDHIKPLCSFNLVNSDGSTNLEEVKKAFASKNHQWLLSKENMSKGGKY